ncbi:DUF3141 domain-containing protein [Bradyrhizobium sp. CSA112]|uniref:DUF3141 domain-containing protein n=1 Tax=Bradyrhizobium sp. CSA112 TaxID=2699170 RepID=UPI0023AF8D9A|nr:DUF3141 domain-containing protein [Bradyrhizobium sp. CSA112]
MLASLSEIQELAPGLYEMKIEGAGTSDDPSNLPFAVRFEPRQVEDLNFPKPDAAFERIRDFSEMAETIYKTLFSPFVQAASNALTAELAKWFHPMRASRYLFSPALLPWLRGLPALAKSIHDNRQPLADDNPYLGAERKLINLATSSIEATRLNRDASLEHMFGILYGFAPPAKSDSNQRTT